MRHLSSVHFILSNLFSAIKMKESTFLLFCILFISLSAGYEEGMVRLVDGRDDTEGRVEIFHHGLWGTVCDDGWDINDAHVVCRQLLFPGAAEALGSSAFGNGDGDILMDDLGCSGSEMNLVQCTFRGWGMHDCGHSEDAGVRCKNEPASMKRDLIQEYDLDHNTSLSHQLGELFDSGRACDLNITVLVQNNTVETICAHRIILSLNLFPKTSQSDFSSLSIDSSLDCSQHANDFVRYLYTRQIKLTQSSVYCILKMASDWGLKEVQDEAANIVRLFLPQDPTFQSLGSFYEYAVHVDDEALQAICLRYLAWNCEALLHSPAWTNLPFGLVKVLLSRSDLVVSNETIILNGLERWVEAQGNTTIPEILLKLIRFPMIPAEDLYTLDVSQYYASRLQGFQFNALPVTTLQNDLRAEQNAYTSRIYTGKPWSFTFSYHNVKTYKNLGFFRLHNQHIDSLTSDFTTPVHNSAYFGLHNMRWRVRVLFSNQDCSSERVTCPSLPAVSLKVEQKNTNLPSEIEGRIRYSNRLVVMCEGVYVFHVHEFNAVNGENLVFVPSSTKQVYPCHTNLFSFQVVVRPQYSTD